MTKTEGKAASAAVKDILLSNPDGLREVIRTVMQEVLEAEMDEALGAAKGERTPERLGYRSGHYGRTLITRVGKLELRVPQDRWGTSPPNCSNAISAPSGRWWQPWRRCMCKGCRRGRSRRSPRSCAAMPSRRFPLGPLPASLLNASGPLELVKSRLHVVCKAFLHFVGAPVFQRNFPYGCSNLCHDPRMRGIDAPLF